MSIRPTWRKKLNHCNSSNDVDVNLPTPIPKPQSTINEPTTHSNHVSLQSHSLPFSDSCDTSVGKACISPIINQSQTQPLFPHLLVNPHVARVLHAQTPPSPQGDNHTQPPLPPSPSREKLMNDINQLQDLSNLLAMHLSQRNTFSSPYSPNLPHTINLDQIEQHVGYCLYLKSKITKDIISNRSFMEVLVLNHYVLVKKVLFLLLKWLSPSLSYQDHQIMVYVKLSLRHQDTINAAARGTFMQKTSKECYDLTENMTAHYNHWDTLATQDEMSKTISSTTTTESPKVIGQLEMLNKNFQEMMKRQSVKYVDTKCKTCGGPHSYTECPAVGGYIQKAAYATT
nr:hypothetical protein [Tanacetum cinerariifolium]